MKAYGGVVVTSRNVGVMLLEERESIHSLVGPCSACSFFLLAYLRLFFHYRDYIRVLSDDRMTDEMERI
jgi:hypothetical protein